MKRLAHTGLLTVHGGEYRLPTETAVGTGEAGDALAAVLAYIRIHGRINRRQLTALLGLTANQAEYRLRQWVQDGKLQLTGRGPAAYYTASQSPPDPFER